MKIKKTYQGAIPLNRIANEHNESEINTYSTNHINKMLEQQNSDTEESIADLAERLGFLETHNVRLNGEPVFMQRQETHEDGSYTRGYYVQGFVGQTVPDGELTVQLNDKALVRNMYGVLYYTAGGTFIPLNYSNPAVPVYTYFNLRTKQVHLYTPQVFGNCEFVLYVEYVLNDV